MWNLNLLHSVSVQEKSYVPIMCNIEEKKVINVNKLVQLFWLAEDSYLKSTQAFGKNMSHIKRSVMYCSNSQNLTN